MLPLEEYIEQAYFFRVLNERLNEGVPIQELLSALREEILASTKLPLAIDFLLSELIHIGTISTAMARLPHYFSPFQSFVVSSAEQERGRFDMRVALRILAAEAEYRSKPDFPKQGLFLFQFETLCRNRMRYDHGLDAIAQDDFYGEHWTEWIHTVRRQIGLVEFGNLLYVRSEYYRAERERRGLAGAEQSGAVVLFGEKEGKIARANIGKDPLFLFAALQRHLGYPAVPRPEPADPARTIVPLLQKRVDRLEIQLKFLEDEQRKGAVDLSKFYRADQPPAERLD